MRSFMRWLGIGLIAGNAASAWAFPSWMGVYGSYTTHNGSNPGVYTILMNQDYYGLHAEVGIGISFIFGFENERQQGFTQVKSAAPCEGTSYEIGGIALVRGARHKAEAIRYYDWLMSPAGQQIGARANSLQVPANKTFKPDPRIPAVDTVRLIKYDFEKYGKAAERRRLIDRWQREVEALPR